MNMVVMMGRLVADPEVRYAQGSAGQTCIARYRLAVDRRQAKVAAQNGQPTADFISCVAFGQRGEFAQKYLHKGMRMLIRGSIRTGSYQNKNGQTVYTTDVVVDDQEFADSKSASNGQNYGTVSDESFTYGDGFMSIPDGVEDDGLPFN